MKQSQMVAAIAKCNQLIAQQPEQAELHAQLGNLYARQGQWQSAIAPYQRAIQLDGKIASVHYNLANVLSQAGKMQLAAESLYRSLELDSNLGDFNKYRALAEFFQSQQLEKSIVCWQQAIALQSSYFPAYQALAELLTKNGRAAEAITIFEGGVRENPQNLQFYLALGRALLVARQWQQAGDRYQQIIDLDPSLAVAHYSRGIVFYELQKYLESSAALQRAIELQPDYWEAHYQLGVVWQQQQQWSEAITAYERVRQINPEFMPSLRQLVMVYRAWGKYEPAIDCCHQWLELATDKAIEREAIENYQQTLAISPQPKAQLYQQFGLLLRAKSYFSEALKAFQQAIAINPYFIQAHNNIQYTPASAENLEGLIAFYRNLLQEHPQIPIAWGNLGDALTQKDRVEEAIACYRKSSYQKAIKQYSHLVKSDWPQNKQLPPDFVIIGASKSGTSSLYKYLSEHPQILLPHKKEIDFFLRYFERGIDWYLAHFPTICDRPDWVTGEATPNYLRFPKVPQRIKESCPQTKLIVLLRNPVERAVSWHYHKLNTGLAKGDLASAIATERERLQHLSEAELMAGGYYNPDNLLSSLYVYQLKPWIELLGRERFLILKSEDFYNDTATVMKRVFDFLGLPDCVLKNYPQVNVGSYAPIDGSLRQTLVEYFQPYNQQLEEFLGMKFNWN
jgi:tetratricopeptide (TPR) repeat protein